MHFSKINSTVFLAILGFSMIGCVPHFKSDSDEYLVGNRVETMSSVRSNFSIDTKKISIYDETVHKIHKFDLVNMQHESATPVDAATEKHYVLYNENNDYIVDLYKGGIGIIANDNTKSTLFSEQISRPVSGVLDASNNTLVVYDEMQTVALVKLNASGKVLDAWLGGNGLSLDATITAGDLITSNILALALSNGKIALVDINNTLASKEWKYTLTPAIGVGVIKWLAPVQGNSNKFFLHSSDNKIFVFDNNTGTITSKYDMSSDEIIMLYSKNGNPHILMFSTSNYKMLKIAYLESENVVTRTLYKQEYSTVLHSSLNQTKNEWSTVSTTTTGYQESYLSLDSIKTNRKFQKYRLSDLLGLNSTIIDDRGKVRIADNFIFQLFPSELGYATRYNINTKSVTELKLFNVRHIQKN